MQPLFLHSYINRQKEKRKKKQNKKTKKQNIQYIYIYIYIYGKVDQKPEREVYVKGEQKKEHERAC